ncbi:FlaD/FlaE family flagellar protein [Natronobacterium texcoconense]|uniref:Flagella accessory protein C (FlaC) n=1 Tax=Natronobacterium texcoconense TaxID=1095778 RepID=A0A1H1IL08_NATTX|nr:FlaD/FlaE family flagellar protein [Natronobacterium texcoconense]SDR38344.1 Flagella accessory protein C (FlaC) [Natronobacterium texcoconense]
MEMDGGDDFLDDDGGFGDGGGGDDFLDDDGGFGDGASDDDMSFGGMDDGGGGGASSELENRIDEMENDVGSLSSTVNTVQSENEKISDSLEEIEEDIRKLLEVYEMVTQGVNPFVEGDSMSEMMGGGGPGGGGGGFGGESLFDSGEGEEDADEMGDDVANAEAEEFLDESVIDDEDEFGDLDNDFGDDGLDDDAESGGADEDLSFDDLKSEYDEDDGFEDGADDGLGDDPVVDDGLEDDGLEDELGMADDEPADLGADDDLGAEIGDAEPADSASAAEDEDVPWDDGGRPYLEEIPSEYDTEYVVMDWLEYLVEKAGLDGAARTIRFYETIGWIGQPVDDCLQTMLNGFDGGPNIEDPEPRSSLGVDHKRSLWRISQISTPARKRRSFDEWLEEEGISTRKTIEIQGTGESDESETEDADETAESDDAPTADEASASDDLGSDTELTFTETIADGPDDDHESDVDDSSGSDDDSDNAVNVAVTGAETETETETEGGDSGYGQIAHEEWIVDDDVDSDREMVWVDSDVMETESGTKLHEGYYGYANHDDYAKPILVPDEQTDLEPWQIEFINSVLISDEGDYE